MTNRQRNHRIIIQQFHKMKKKSLLDLAKGIQIANLLVELSNWQGLSYWDSILNFQLNNEIANRNKIFISISFLFILTFNSGSNSGKMSKNALDILLDMRIVIPQASELTHLQYGLVGARAAEQFRTGSNERAPAPGL